MRIIPYKSTWHIGRLAFYIATLLLIYSIDLEKLMTESICYWYTTYNVLCPTCGGTRSFLNFLHLNFLEAFNYNSALTLGLYPLATFLVIQDAFAIFVNTFSHKQLPSLLLFFMNLFNRRNV